MKFYDYNKARQIMSTLNYETATLGMAEDWFWTAQDITFDTLPEVNIIEEHNAYRAREEELRHKGFTFNQRRKILNMKFPNLMIKGICSSTWATPCLRLTFKNGKVKWFHCFIQVGSAELPADLPIIPLGDYAKSVQQAVLKEIEENGISS